MSNAIENVKSDETDTNEQDVKVKVLLTGGHQYTLALRSDTPLLKSLLGTILSRVQNQGSRTLFQIPVEAGRAGVCFCSDDLVAVMTEPPVYVKPNDDQPPMEGQANK